MKAPPARMPSPFVLALWRHTGRLIALRPQRWSASAPHPVLAEALGDWAHRWSDIHDHLGTLFVETAASGGGLVVELGVRSGLSTRALLAAADVAGGRLISVDLCERPTLEGPERLLGRWSFVQSDDVAFAGAPFAAWCAERGLDPIARAIFLDTSHRYEHTRAELAAWLPRLAPGGALMLHDTNMGDWFRTLDGRVTKGWDNDRGVMRAIEEILGRAYDETTYFTDCAAGFAVSHRPWGSGFTVLRRI